jgi:hypothetical protein
MDLQLRKIQFVQEFLRLSNEQIINKLEHTLKFEKTKLYGASTEPLSMEEFNGMIDSAEDDSENNRMRSVHELKSDAESWT